MSTEKHLEVSLKTLAATILLGLLGNLLLRDFEWGVGFTIYFVVILSTCVYLYRKSMVRFSTGILWLIAPALLFASTFAWRDSESLRWLNGTCLALIVGLAALRRHDRSITVGSVFDYPFRLFGRWFEFVADAIPLARLEGRWSALSTHHRGQRAVSVGRGLLIAAPLLLLFGGLFMSADAAFEHLVISTTNFDSESLTSNLLISLACAWLVGGFLRRMFLAVDHPPKDKVKIYPIFVGNREVFGPITPPRDLRLGVVEVATVLGSLNLLFMMFVGTQLGYFFGGDAHVQTTAGLGYADYARRGFFELSAVAALALPVLLGAYSLIKRDGDSAPRAYKVTSGVLVGLLVVVMASAAFRMKLYVDVYGISMLRIYVVASIVWLTGVFAWFGLTVLRDKPQRFAFGGLVMFLATIFALDVMNPEALTARINTTRIASTEIDTDYLTDLSSDAIPELSAARARVKPEVRERLDQGLELAEEQLAKENWRSWSLADAQAKRSIE